MDLFNFIKQNVDILSVIGEYTHLKKAGSLYWKGNCPFHHEKTPSFSVSPHKNMFYCFGCQESGDVIAFIEKIEHISAFEAAQHLAQRYNLQIPEDSVNASSQLLNKQHYKICHVVAQWCNLALLKNQPALSYLQKRNISPSTIAQFSIGFFPPGTNGIQQLIAYISPLGFSSQNLLDQHIVFNGKTNLYSPFEDRIIFPIKDHLGQSCGFGGRIFLSHDTRPKYYNSMETEQFKKGKILFGMDLAKHDIQKQKSAFLVEGYTDCVAMHQHGFKNVVATLGTACTTDHLMQITKHAQTIYLLYDADVAGKKAIMRLTPICWQMNLDVKVITLPLGQDPASMLENNASLSSYVTSALDIFAFFLQEQSDQFSQASMKNKMETIQELFELVSQVQDSFKQNILLMKISESLQIPLEIIKKEYINRYGSKIQTSILDNQQKAMPTQQDRLEEQIVAIIIHNPTLLTEQHETLLLACLSNQAHDIVKKIIDYKTQQLLHIKAEEIQYNLAIILSKEELQETEKLMFMIETANIQQTFDNLMLQFQKKYWKSIVCHIKLKLGQAVQENNETEKKRLLGVFENLKLELYKKGRL